MATTSSSAATVTTTFPAGGTGHDFLIGGTGDDWMKSNDDDEVDKVDAGDGFDICFLSAGDEVNSCEYQGASPASPKSPGMHFTGRRPGAEPAGGRAPT